MNFEIANWFWRVGNDRSRVWSSARSAWVDVADQFFTDWAADGSAPTPIASIDDLAAVFNEAYPAGMLTTYVAAKRFKVETGGVVINGMKIATDRESQAMISGAFNYVSVETSATLSFKTDAGFVSLNADEVRTLALAVGKFVQSCFEKEAEVSVQIASGTISSIASIDAAFQALTDPPSS